MTVVLSELGQTFITRSYRSVPCFNAATLQRSILTQHIRKTSFLIFLATFHQVCLE